MFRKIGLEIKKKKKSSTFPNSYNFLELSSDIFYYNGKICRKFQKKKQHILKFTDVSRKMQIHTFSQLK